MFFKKFLPLIFSFMFLVLISFSDFFLKNVFSLSIILILIVMFFSEVMNTYLSEIIPASLKFISKYLSNSSKKKFNFIFAIFSCFIWNFSLYLPYKIFEIFTVALIFIPNFINKGNNDKINNIFKILLIYIALQFLDYFHLTHILDSKSKIKYLLNTSEIIDFNKIFLSIFEAVLYTKFYFLSLQILDECINTTYKDKVHKEVELPD